MKKFLILTFTILTLIAPGYSCNAETSINLSSYSNSITSNSVELKIVLDKDTDYRISLNKDAGIIENFSKSGTSTGSDIISFSGLEEFTNYRAILYITEMKGENPSSYVDFKTKMGEPKITNISPTSGTVNTEVTITGKNFSSVNYNLFFNNTKVGNYDLLTGTTIKTKVPSSFTEGPITLQWTGDNGVSKSVVSSEIFTQPKIYFNPAEGKVNDIIKIHSGSEIRGSELVIFNENKNVIPPDNSQVYYVEVAIPEGASTGKVSIKTPKYGVITSTMDFVVTPAVGIGTSGAVPSIPPIIASGTTTTYKVVSGDTLGGIATKFTTTVAILKSLNPGKIVNENKIEVDWVLVVPNTPAATPVITFNGKSLVPDCNTGEIGADGNYVNKCDFNMIMALVNKIIEFCLIYLATPLFALIMIYVGYLYLTASASSENINLAKKILKNALFGYVIALAAWLVVKSVLTTLGVIGIDKYLQ